MRGLRRIIGVVCVTGGVVAVVAAVYWSYLLVQFVLWGGGTVHWVNVCMIIFVTVALSASPLVVGAFLLRKAKRAVDGKV
jgi:hypothetical protein